MTRRRTDFYIIKTATRLLCLLALAWLTAVPGAAQILPYQPDFDEIPAQSSPPTQPPKQAPLPAAGLDEVEDIRDIRGPVSITSPWLIVLYVALVIALGLIIAFLIYLFLKQHRQITAAPSLSPYEQALKDLSDTRPLMLAGEDKAFTIAVSDVLRTYLENQFSMPAPGRTTEEFLTMMTGHTLIKETLSGLLSDFLLQCDLVKFARQPLGRKQMQELFRNAEKFILESYVKFMMQETLTGNLGVKPMPEAIPVTS